ncbi:MAG: quinone-dependent dihydroorotate dehydrogenase [Pyrinomonadaceae bacterium]
MTFANPVGLAAGFDKNGEAAQAFAAFGFGHIETGTVTFHAQPGNPRPRIFRLPEDKAIINRAGFNNHGAQALVEKLKNRRPACVLGINIGKSRSVDIENATEDYLASFEIVCHAADYIAINVSSPNTPHLRELQRADALDELLAALQERNRACATANARAPLPLLVKIAPDINFDELEMIVAVALRHDFDGIIATNTTTRREGLKTSARKVEILGAGGLSGAPLREQATNIIAALHRLIERERAIERLKIIGVGGIFTAEDAWEKICAGASLVQIYTGFIYEGATIVRNINDGLVGILHREGFNSLEHAVGCRASEFITA